MKISLVATLFEDNAEKLLSCLEKKLILESIEAGPALGFGLPNPITILVIHLLLNIKKHHKSPKKKKNLCKINVTLCF